MKKFLLFLMLAALMLVNASCADEPDFRSEVLRVENHVSHSEGDDHWHCRDAIIYVNRQLYIAMFPEQYEADIVPGTMITYHCNIVTNYYKDGKKVTIDWEGTKM